MRKPLYHCWSSFLSTEGCERGREWAQGHTVCVLLEVGQLLWRKLALGLAHIVRKKAGTQPSPSLSASPAMCRPLALSPDLQCPMCKVFPHSRHVLHPPQCPANTPPDVLIISRHAAIASTTPPLTSSTSQTPKVRENTSSTASLILSPSRLVQRLWVLQGQLRSASQSSVLTASSLPA